MVFWDYRSKEFNRRTNRGMQTVPAAMECVKDPFRKMVIPSVDRIAYRKKYYNVFLPPAAGVTVNRAVRGLFDGTKSPAEAAQAIDDAFVEEIRT